MLVDRSDLEQKSRTDEGNLFNHVPTEKSSPAQPPDRGRWIFGTSQEDLVSILEALPCGIAVQHTSKGKFLYINEACIELTGYDLIDIPTPRIGSRKLRPSRRLNKTVSRSVQKTAHGEQSVMRSNFMSKQGELKCLEGKTTTASNGMTISVWADVTDQWKAEQYLRKTKEELEHAVEKRLSELVSLNKRLLKEIGIRKRAEAELEKSREELRSLSEHLQRTREDERNSLARHVHDELAQALSALKIDVVRMNSYQNEEARRRQSEAVQRQLDQILRVTKNICGQLRPPELEHLGLAEALRLHITEFERRSGLDCTLRISPRTIQLEQSLAIVLFRVIQEALVNVARHADATIVYISLEQKDRRIALKVRDNGKGISKKDMEKRNSFGIIGMRERIRVWDGTVKFFSVPDKGTTLSVVIPVGTFEGISVKRFRDARKDASLECNQAKEGERS